MMDVSDVLRDRMQTPAGLQRMVAVSLSLHVIVATVMLLAPGRWFGRQAEAPRVVMTISLGGNAAPDSGGMTTMGGRPEISRARSTT